MMENKDQKDWHYALAKKQVTSVKNFYIHLAAFVFVNSFILMLNTRHQSITEFLNEGNSLRNLVLWGIVLIIHWAVVLGAPFLLGNNWERKKLKELMDKDRQRWE